MKKLFAEFKAFVNKGNALSLAIGVILGASFTAIVTAINQKIISPLIGLLLGDNDLSESLITVLKTAKDPETGETIITNAIYWGAFIQSVIDFALTAVILFAIFKIAGKFTSALKKAADMEEWIDFKLEKGIKLTKRERAFKEKLISYNVKSPSMYIYGCHLIDLILTIWGVPNRVIPFNKKTLADNLDFEDSGFGKKVLAYKLDEVKPIIA